MKKKPKLKPSPAVVGEVKPSDYNPRSISPEQLDVLGRSMRDSGDLSGIVWNRRTGNTVGGHQRIKQLDPQWKIMKLDAQDKTGTVAVGYIETPFGKFSYREVDWPIEKEKLANLAANRIGGEFEYDQVGEIMKSLNGKMDLSLTGFDSTEIKSLIEGLGAEVDLTSAVIGEKFEVVVECKNEREQQEVFEQMKDDGHKCRLITL